MTDIKTTKSEDFAISIVLLTKELSEHHHEYIMSKQLLRSGTSIGANIAEAKGSESKSDFIHKLSIAQKEAFETAYWLKLLYRTNYLSLTRYQKFNRDCQELIRILTAVIVRCKNEFDKGVG